MSSPTKVSRRTFLKDAALAGAASAMTTALGAGPAFAAQAAPTTWDAEADVVVVGTGIAGFCAAFEAFDAGATVLMVEKQKWAGGCSVMANGSFIMPANHINKKANVEDKVEWAYEDFFNNGKWRGTPELLHQFVDGAADTALYLEKLGIVWSGPTLQLPDNRVPRTIRVNVGPMNKVAGGLGLLDVLTQNATKRKIPIKYEHKMTRLIRPNNTGPVLGIEVTNAGKTLNFKAKKAVVLASGGFKCNWQMLKSWHPAFDEVMNFSGGPYVNVTGDGHQAAMAVGAGVTDMSFTCGFSIKFGTSIPSVWEPQTYETPILSTGLAYRIGNTSAMMVDNDGNRWVDEHSVDTGEADLETEWIQRYLNLPKRPRKAWAIVDSVGAVDLGWKLDDIKNASLTKAPYLDPKMVAWGDTVADLAKMMGIDEKALAASVTRFNGWVTQAIDRDFDRPRGFRAISTAPFMAARLLPMTHDQGCGLRANTKMQVIDQTFQRDQGQTAPVALDKERVIPHLYAAGEIVGGLWGAARGHGKIGSYAVQGRVAGKTAVTETAV
jgi:urocanate reductase